MSLTNLDIAELLARAGDDAEGHRKKAYAKASRAALLWEQEASEVVEGGGSPSDLEAIGDRLGARIEGWLADPPEIDGIPPIRSGFSTYAVARRTLEQRNDSLRLRGDLQMHTTYSDGKASVREMALTAAGMDYEYIAVTDHSQSLRIVRGMDEARLAAQGKEIDGVNEEFRREGLEFSVLRSIEMDISPEGEGDMEPESLQDLDLVLGSFHSQLRITEDQTDRYIAALRNPHVSLIAHPRGRKWNIRTGLSADWRRVFEVANELDKAVEINAYPHRQDLAPELLPLARDSGVRISIGTDSHDPTELRFVDVGIAAALDAGIPPERILNCSGADEIKEWARTLRS